VDDGDVKRIRKVMDHSFRHRDRTMLSSGTPDRNRVRTATGRAGSFGELPRGLPQACIRIKSTICKHIALNGRMRAGQRA